MRTSIILILISLNTAFGQSYKKTLAQVGNKVSVVYPDHIVRAETKPCRGTVFPNPGKSYFWYASNKINFTQGGFSGKLLNGSYSDYYADNKALKEKGAFKKGLKYGEWLSWYSNGRLKEKVEWISGKRNGPFMRYSQDGRLIEKGKYRNDKLQGEYFVNPGTDSVKTLHYRNGISYLPEKGKDSSLLKRLFHKKTISKSPAVDRETNR